MFCKKKNVCYLTISVRWIIDSILRWPFFVVVYWSHYSSFVSLTIQKCERTMSAARTRAIYSHFFNKHLLCTLYHNAPIVNCTGANQLQCQTTDCRKRVAKDLYWKVPHVLMSSIESYCIRLLYNNWERYNKKKWTLLPIIIITFFNARN